MLHWETLGQVKKARNTKGHILYDSVDTKYPEQTNP